MLPFVFSYKRSPVNHVNENYSPCNSFTLSIVVLISTFQQGDIVLIPLYMVLSITRQTPIHHPKTPPPSSFPIPYS